MSEQSAAELVDGLNDSQLEFLLYFLSLPQSVQSIAIDMLTDGVEMLEEGCELPEIEQYLRRSYGL